MARWKITVEEPVGQGTFVPFVQDDVPVVFDDQDGNLSVQDRLNELQAADNEGRCYGAAFDAGEAE